MIGMRSLDMEAEAPVLIIEAGSSPPRQAISYMP